MATRSNPASKYVFATGLVIAGVLAWASISSYQVQSSVAAEALTRQSKQPGATMEKMRGEVRQALLHDPLDAPALRVFAKFADGQGQKAQAARLYSTAGRLTKRDSETQVWLLTNSLQRQQYDAAVRHADALLRLDRTRITALSPTMLALASNDGTRDSVVDKLKHNPAWRNQFMADLANASNSGATFAILKKLEETANKPTDEEVGWYLSNLVTNRRFDEALLSWLLLMPANRVENFIGLYDGGFEGQPGPLPFNWTFGSGAEIAPDPKTEGKNSLLVSSPTLQGGLLASQLLVLTPGSYRLVWTVSYEDPKLADSLSWTVTCADTGQVLTDGAGGSAGSFWTTFTVPSGNECRGQMLRLAAAPVSRRIVSDAWFNDLKIESAPTRQAATVVGGRS